MKKVILILIATLGLVACGTKEATKVELITIKAVEPKAMIEFSNPALMGGSDFGTFLISMFSTQDYDRALLFTSKGSIEKFGRKKIEEKYASFEYNYKLSRKSVKEINDTIVLKLNTTEFATGKFKTLKLVRENDTCKLVLQDNLDIFIK